MPGTRSLFARVYGDLPALTWLVCAAAFVNRAGSMVVPFLSLWLGQRFGYSVADAGLVVSLYGLGACVGNLLGGRLVDRFGAVRVQVTTLAAAAAWMLLLSFADRPLLLGAGVFVLGVLNDAFRPANLAAVVASAPAEHRTRALTLNRLAVNAGWAIGPTVGGQLAMLDFRWLFVADGATCALAALLLLRWVPRDLDRRFADEDAGAGLPGAAPSPASPWRHGQFLLLLGCSVLFLLAFMQYFSTETRHLEQALGFDESQIGWLLAINPVLITVLEMPLAHALRGRPQLPLVAFGSVLVGLAFPLLAPASWALGGVVLSLLVLTVGEMFYSPFLGAFVSDRAPPRARGSWLGAYGASFAFAFVLAPALGGLVYDGLGADALWFCCCGAGLLAAAGFLWLHRTWSPPSVGQFAGRTASSPPAASSPVSLSDTGAPGPA